MQNYLNVSIIIPVYNSEKTIKNTLNKIINEASKLISEIIVIDDNSTDDSTKIIKEFGKKIKLIELKKNGGVGNARNSGASIAKYENLCFIDSDIEITEDSIVNLVNRLKLDDSTGSVSATQNLKNLNTNSWSSDFVCLKSCYGTDKFKDEIVFSTICSEFCVISKKLFFKLNMWKNVNSAGGEEFDMGYKILKSNKKNIKTLSARYSGYWCNISTRFKRIVDRTSKYIPLLLKKRKFDTKGSFATFEQSLSSFLTLILAILLFINFILIGNNLSLIIIFILIFQYIIELGFLKFVFKNRGIKMLIFSLFGIHVINLGIILGVVYFIFKKMFFIK